MKDFCAYFNQGLCRSCTLMDLEYGEQLKRKENLLLKSYTDFGEAPLLPTVVSPIQGFRNKAKMVVTGTLENPIIGIAGDQNLDQGKEILHCPVHHPKINLILSALKEFIQTTKLVPYNIEKKTGELKGLILFYSEESDEMYVRFILRSKESIDRIKKNAIGPMNTYPFIRTVSANIQPIPHAILEGPEEILLAGSIFLDHKLGDIHLEIRTRAFVQTNQTVSRQLYATAAAWVKEISANKFTELFCGQGAFSFFVAPYVKQALGIEINEEAVKSANHLAQKSGLSHLSFIAQDASLVLNALDQFSPDIVLVNPPRKGLGGALEIFKNRTYQHLIYSSCSYETLASDLKILKNYKVERTQIFDMFPHTGHFETLVHLTPR